MERLATPPAGPRGRAKQRHRSRGQSVVEFALMLPVFLVVVVGVVDFGTLLFARMTVIDLAREGAQYGSTLGNPGSIESNVPSHVMHRDDEPQSDVPHGQRQLLEEHHLEPVAAWLVQFGECRRPVNDSVKVVIGYAYHPFFPLWFGSTINVSSTEWMTLYPPPSS